MKSGTLFIYVSCAINGEVCPLNNNIQIVFAPGPLWRRWCLFHPSRCRLTSPEFSNWWRGNENFDCQDGIEDYDDRDDNNDYDNIEDEDGDLSWTTVLLLVRIADEDGGQDEAPARPGIVLYSRFQDCLVLLNFAIDSISTTTTPLPFSSSKQTTKLCEQHNVTSWWGQTFISWVSDLGNIDSSF